MLIYIGRIFLVIIDKGPCFNLFFILPCFTFSLYLVCRFFVCHSFFLTFFVFDVFCFCRFLVLPFFLFAHIDFCRFWLCRLVFCPYFICLLNGESDFQ